MSFGDQGMPYHAAWFETLEALGYPQTEDPINGAGTGPFVSLGAVDPKSHTRSHAAAAVKRYLERIRNNSKRCVRFSRSEMNPLRNTRSLHSSFFLEKAPIQRVSLVSAIRVSSLVLSLQ